MIEGDAGQDDDGDDTTRDDGGDVFWSEVSPEERQPQSHVILSERHSFRLLFMCGLALLMLF